MNTKKAKPRIMILRYLNHGIVSPNKIYRELRENDCFISRQQVYNILAELTAHGYAKKEVYGFVVRRIRYKPLIKESSFNLDM